MNKLEPQEYRPYKMYMFKQWSVTATVKAASKQNNYQKKHIQLKDWHWHGSIP